MSMRTSSADAWARVSWARFSMPVMWTSTRVASQNFCPMNPPRATKPSAISRLDHGMLRR